MTATVNYTGAGWALVPGTSVLTLPAALLVSGTLEVTPGGFTPGVTYYNFELTLPASYDSPGTASGKADVSATYQGIPQLVTAVYPTGAGQLSPVLTISFPAAGFDGAVLNSSGPIFVTILRAGDSGVPSQSATWGLTVTPIHQVPLTASTNSGDGGISPPDPILLSVAPSGTTQVLQGSSVTIDATAISAVSGTFFDPQNFNLAVNTPGLGLFDNLGTNKIVPNVPFTPRMEQQVFTFAPGFAGIGQIRCSDSYSANGPLYWTFDVVAPAPPVSANDYGAGMMLVIT